jgi:hypothetical protein
VGFRRRDHRRRLSRRGTLATLAFVRFRLREPVTVTLGTGAIAYLTLYLVFEKMLGQVLFQGLIVGG